MIKSIITQWEANKGILENYFRNTPQSEYDKYEFLFKKTIELATPKVGVYRDWLGEEQLEKIDIDKMTIVDDGDYQGTQLFLIPIDTYQPDVTDYLITDNYYGSCSGCDTIQRIHSYDMGKPNEQQVKDYMSLALHLIQKLRWLNKAEVKD